MSAGRGIITSGAQHVGENLAVVLIAVALCVAPAICAWFGISASWDPARGTSQLKVAVANEDKGYESDLLPVSANLGNRVMASLRGDDSYGWVFVDADEALEGVQSGEYYSAIVMPSDFSQKLMSSFSSTGERAVVQYYVNTKDNPVGYAVATEDSQVVSDVGDVFSQHVSAVSASMVSDVADTSDSNKMQMVAEQLSSRLGIVADTLNSAEGQVDLFGGLLDSASSLTQVAAASIAGTGGAGTQTGNIVGNAAASVRQAANALRNATENAKQVGSRTPNIAGPELLSFTSDADALASGADRIASSAESLSSSLASAVSSLDGSTDSLSAQLDSTHTMLVDASLRLRESAETVRQLRTDIVEALTAGDMLRVADLIGDNASSTARWLAAPVQIERHATPEVQPHGSTTAPFHTALALWVGVVLIVLALRVRGDDDLQAAGAQDDAQRAQDAVGIPNAVSYFRRFLVYALLGVMQACLVWIVEVLLMGVQCSHPVLYLLMCVFCSLAFMAVAYALAVLLGRIGEALCLVLLVLQVVGGSGYPVAMMGDAFQVANPLLPFAHAIDALRECTGALNQADLITALLCLCAFLAASLVVGLVLRAPLARIETSFKADPTLNHLI